MGLWIFLLVMNLLAPFTMIGFGSYFAKKAPKEINMLFGYRTAMSMKNKETWEFAHHHCGKIFRVAGWVLLLGSLAAMLLMLGRDEDFVGTGTLVIHIVQIVVLLGAIVPTEIALKKTFDKDGNRKEQG